jgi:hypothetical protein
MKIVACSKQSVSRSFAPHLAHWLGEDVVYVHSFYFTAVRAVYPKALHWADLPVCLPPQFSICRDAKRLDWRPRRAVLENGQWTIRPLDGENQWHILNAARREDIVVCDARNDPCSYYLHKMLMLGCPAYAADPRVPYAAPTDWNGAAFAEAVAMAADERMFLTPDEPIIRSTELKKFFEYNFNANAAPLFGEAVERAGGARSRVMTKFMLPALALFAEKSLTDGQAIQHLQDWSGTGKYEGRAEIGSPASRASLLENLLHMRLLARHSQRPQRLHLTMAGERFLKLFVHKDCLDPDLPFRLNLWSELPEATAKAKMARYLNTYFGKQKRLLDRVGRLS